MIVPDGKQVESIEKCNSIAQVVIASQVEDGTEKGSHMVLILFHHVPILSSFETSVATGTRLARSTTFLCFIWFDNSGIFFHLRS